jgi:hypothetical protein
MISHNDINSIAGIESKVKVNSAGPRYRDFCIVVEHEGPDVAFVDSNEENRRIEQIGVGPEVGLEDEAEEPVEGGVEVVAVVHVEGVGYSEAETNVASAGDVNLTKRCQVFRTYNKFLSLLLGKKRIFITK